MGVASAYPDEPAHGSVSSGRSAVGVEDAERHVAVGQGARGGGDDVLLALHARETEAEVLVRGGDRDGQRSRSRRDARWASAARRGEGHRAGRAGAGDEARLVQPVGGERRGGDRSALARALRTGERGARGRHEAEVQPAVTRERAAGGGDRELLAREPLHGDGARLAARGELDGDTPAVRAHDSGSGRGKCRRRKQAGETEETAAQHHDRRENSRQTFARFHTYALPPVDHTV